MRSICQVVLPLDLGIKISENDPARKLVEICDGLNYEKLYSEYLRNWRKIDPAVLFEIVVLAYMHGKYSSREIEDLCRNDIRFMWLLGGEAAPDHATIARFQNERLVPVVEDLFYQLANKLIELGEISYNNVFVDGTKIEANANRYTFVWTNAVKSNRRKLNIRLEKELPLLAKKYGIDESCSLEEVLYTMESYANMYGIQFVYGSGRRKTALQRDYDKLKEYKAKLDAYEESLGICGKRKSFSKTDTDATFMRTKDDHMQNGQLKPCYNVQICVESEYITGLGLFPNPADTMTLIPFLKRVQNGCGRKIQSVTADAGYASEENYTYLEENGQEAYIKPTDYEVRKTKRFKENIYRVENLLYDEEKDTFTCPNEKRLFFVGESYEKTESGYVTTKKNYVCEGCEGCSHREKCYKAKDCARQISVSQTMRRLKREATERINTERGIILRQNRSIQVEGAFGVLKEDFRFRRFLTRGKAKTETQFFILAIAFNVQKLWNREKFERFNMFLFNEKAS